MPRQWGRRDFLPKSVPEFPLKFDMYSVSEARIFFPFHRGLLRKHRWCRTYLSGNIIMYLLYIRVAMTTMGATALVRQK